MNEKQELAVGEPYAPGPLEPGPKSYFSLIPPGRARIVLAVEKPTEAEIRAINDEPVTLGVLTHGRMLFVLARAGGLPWADCPYNVTRLAPPDRPRPEQYTPGFGLPLEVVLVDAATGKVAALRLLAVPPLLAIDLWDAIRAQLAEPLSLPEQEQLTAAAYRRWPTPEDMASAASVRQVE